MEAFTGKVWVLGDDIDTDIIIPTEYLALKTIDDMKQYGFSPLRPELAGQIEKGDIIVAGKNFGCGSSREQAPEIIKALGISCVIAKSFARIFFRNSINNGLLLIEQPDLHDQSQKNCRNHDDDRPIEPNHTMHLFSFRKTGKSISEFPKSLFRSSFLFFSFYLPRISPLATPRPLQKSKALIVDFPSGRRRRIRTLPSPQAIRIPSLSKEST